MYLERLYSNPSGLFEPVVFKNGMNIIYGKKEVDQPKNSLNSIGKSTFLDLIDFCLLASPTATHNPRINAAKDLLSPYQIVLEFSIEENYYKIKRSISKTNVVELSVNGVTEVLKDSKAKERLANLVFRKRNYEGKFSSKWFRSLIGFYLKIQKFKQDKFVDPVKYIKEIPEAEINIYHFYLLGFDNSLSFQNLRHRIEEKRLKPTIDEIKRFVKEKYDLHDLKETQIEINKIRLEIKRLQSAINTFKLGDQYEDAEQEANKLTEQIKNHLFQNHIDRERIRAYEDSYQIKSEISTRRITRLFKELDEDFGKKVSKTINDAIAFRKNLAESRKEFLAEEIEKLKKAIAIRDEIMESAEQTRSKLFRFLSQKEAISDLTEAFYNLSTKRQNLAELESNSKILTDLITELMEVETEINKLKAKSILYLNRMSNALTDFFEIFEEIFNTIYLDDAQQSNFSITQNFRKKSLLEISVKMPDMYGKGKNQGRTLVYDLAVLLHSIAIEAKFPHFIVHDGIFDGMDKSHFISTYELVEAKALTQKIQYITTLNEEGTLSQKFGNTDLITPERIEDEAILVLSPSRKLFGATFDTK